MSLRPFNWILWIECASYALKMFRLHVNDSQTISNCPEYSYMNLEHRQMRENYKKETEHAEQSIIFHIAINIQSHIQWIHFPNRIVASIYTLPWQVRLWLQSWCNAFYSYSRLIYPNHTRKQLIVGVITKRSKLMANIRRTSASWPLSLFLSFFLFLQPCLIHAWMPDWYRAFGHGGLMGRKAAKQNKNTLKELNQDLPRHS